MGGQEVKVTNIKFIDKETGAVILMIKEAEVIENWVPFYKNADRGLWSVYSYSCGEVDDDLNRGQGK